ncbi:MAG: Crp/Fnr family transcriptional regulator [Spirochaetales bacterium]|jgi:CRP-like cAMP-binding protein|nr:Crp/Fnr family transcriptional regulator [Spirochaetales bacterium]
MEITDAEVLRRCELFASLSEAEKRRLAGEVKRKKLKKGETLHTPFEKCTGITVASSGGLEISRVLASGDRAVIRQVVPYETFGEAVCQTGGCYPGWTHAVVDSIVLEVGYSSILSCCNSQSFLADYLRGIGGRIQMLLQRIECMSYRTLSKKLACYLLNRAQRGSHQTFVKTEMSITGMADFLGSSREALSRKISEFEKMGILRTEHRTIHILRPDVLEDLLYADFDSVLLNPGKKPASCNSPER